MVNVRLHHGDLGGASSPAPCGAGGRLNLLLSCARWQPDPWVERLPRLLEPMGVLSLEARTGAHASRIIRSNQIHVAVVDLALPLDDDQTEAPELSEGGSRILELLARLESPPPVVAVKRSRTHRDDARDIASALRLGAFAIIDPPRGQSDLDLILDILRRCLERHYRGCWPRTSEPEG